MPRLRAGRDFTRLSCDTGWKAEHMAGKPKAEKERPDHETNPYRPWEEEPGKKVE